MMIKYKKTTKKTANKFYKYRLLLVISFIFIIATGLVARLGYLFILQKTFLEDQGDARSIRVVTTPAYRGMILDRNSQPLAVSTAVATVWANPSIIFKDDSLEKYNYKVINSILELSEGYLEGKLLEHKSKEFIYIKRHIAPDTAQAIKKLNLPGIFIKKAFKRYYSNGEATAHITGFTSIDEVGQEGLEYAYENKLKGTSAKAQVLKDRLGNIIKTIKQDSVAKPGDNISLSIDLRIQYLTYKALKQAINKHNATAGIAVVLDVTSGEILALANQPSYNPNDRINLDHNEVRNRAVTDLFEPGSLIKPISMAAALSTGKFNDDMVIDTNPGYIKMGHNKVQDIRNYGEIKLFDVLKKSSNVGITKLTLESDSSNLVNLLYNMGFTEPTSVNFPGEATGWINDIKSDKGFQLATLAFGYGISVTPLQLLQAYSVIANHGRLVPITMLKQDADTNIYNNNMIIKKETADKVLSMLNNVMKKDGTGRLAIIPNYESSGKTGTTRIVKKSGYSKDSHNAMYVGLAPYPSPKLAMLVFIIEPKVNGYYGGEVAGPVFKKVMSRALPLYGIAPTNIKKS